MSQQFDLQPFLDTLNTKMFGKIDINIREQKLNEFIALLKQQGAVIAGGSVLSSYAEFKSNDFDIYVHCDKSYEIHKFLTVNKIAKLSMHLNLAPAYDQSFFRKNHILARFNYRILKTDYMIDIMLVMPTVSIVNVVSNFDLTFCEIWYDGEKVLANDKDGILQKCGKIRKEYLRSLLVYFNKFILNRIYKYINRGFKISYEIDPEIIINKEVSINVSKKILLPESEEEWVVKTLYKEIIKKYKPLANKITSVYIISKNCLTDFTINNLKNILRHFNVKEGEIKEYSEHEINTLFINCIRTLVNYKHMSEYYVNILLKYTNLTHDDLYIEQILSKTETIKKEKEIWTEMQFKVSGEIKRFIREQKKILSELPDKIERELTETINYLNTKVSNNDYLDFAYKQQKIILNIDNNNLIKLFIMLLFIKKISDIIGEDMFKIGTNTDLVFYNVKDENNKVILNNKLQPILLPTKELEPMWNKENLPKLNNIISNCFSSAIAFKEKEFLKNKFIDFNKEKLLEIINTSNNKKLKVLNIDENIKLPETCIDIIGLLGNNENEDKLTNYLIKNNSFIFVLVPIVQQEKYDALCYDKDSLINILADKRDNIFYECGQSREYQPYVKLSAGNINVYIKYEELIATLKSKTRVFYIVPFVDENNRQIKIKKTESYKNALNIIPEYVSSNHCQEGSEITLYTIKVCNKDSAKCIISDRYIE